VTKPQAAIGGSEGGGRGHKPRNTGGLWKLGKSKGMASSQCFQKEHRLADILMLPSEISFALQTYRTVR
jgi:hypothetical protein